MSERRTNVCPNLSVVDAGGGLGEAVLLTASRARCGA